MSKKSCMLFTSKPEDHDEVGIVRAVADEAGFSFGVVSGTVEGMITEFASWEMLPELLVLDVPPGEDPELFLSRIVEVAPEGESETVVLNAANDIDMYRRMKEAGVVEVFKNFPSPDDLLHTLRAIALREVLQTGIDPRRAVYVWGTSGGCGGTTFALAFAHHMAKKGRRTLVLDMDVHTAPVSFMLAAEQGALETTGFLDMLINPSRIDGLFLQRSLAKGSHPNLMYLSARLRQGDQGLQAKALPMLIQAAQKSFDMVVIDTPWRSPLTPEWGKVNGQNYVVSLPSASGLLGFSSVTKDLASQAAKNPIFGILNKQGEFKANDITMKMFSEGFTGKLLAFPYDPVDAGKLFFAQKTFDELTSGRAKKPMQAILATLPRKAESTSTRVRRRGAAAAALPGAVSAPSKGLLSRLLGR